MDVKSATSPFSWNVGGWFGAQLGCTLWLLILGFVLLQKDLLAAWVCLFGFVILNGWGSYLWRGRVQFSAYVAIQRFLVAATVMIGLVVVVVNIRGVSEPTTSGALVSTYLPSWVIGVGPSLMFVSFLMERKGKQRHGEHGRNRGSTGPTSTG